MIAAEIEPGADAFGVVVELPGLDQDYPVGAGEDGSRRIDQVVEAPAFPIAASFPEVQNALEMGSETDRCVHGEDILAQTLGRGNPKREKARGGGVHGKSLERRRGTAILQKIWKTTR